MSEAIVFRKKSRRQFRKKNLNDDNEEEGELEQATEEKVTEKQEKKPAKPAPSALLSFDHEDDESGEVFKVKKSKESRKLSKQRGKIKKSKEERPEEKSPPRIEDADQKLESLREELSNLGGDEGEERADQDGEKEGKSGEFRTPLTDGIRSDNFGGIRKGNAFHIPDAAAIHAARKSREMARQLGGDYVPLDDTNRYSGRFETIDKSRLIREDDNDHSDDDEDGMTLGFGTRKSNTHPELQRRLEVEQALAKESDEGENSEEEDEALRRFEEEQIRKGVSIPQAQQEDDSLYNMYVQQNQYQEGTLEPSYAAQSTSMQLSDQMTLVPEFQQPSYPPTSLNTVTIDMIYEKINNRVISLQEVHRGRQLEMDKISSRLESCDTSITSLEKQMGDAERRFGYFQEMRGYVRDLLECLNEKMAVIEDLEKRMHSLMKQKSERLIERRQQDVRDQAEDFAAAQAGKSAQPHKAEFDEFGRDKSMYAEQAKQRRAVERDARRNRRKRQREMAKQEDSDGKSHHEGLSSDDEEGSGDTLRFQNESEKILNEAKGIFEDVLEDFSSIDAIKARFQQWKYGFPETYKQAFIHLCLPKVVLPFVKIELLDWNPLMKGCKDFEEMSWFESLMFYGFKDNSYDPDDEDTNLIPRLADKALLPKLTGLIENVWDPLSLKQTILAVNLVKRLVLDYPTVSAEKKSTQELFNAVINRIKKCTSDDIYVPLYPKSLLDKKSIGAEAFVERQFWSCLKLLGNIFLWHGLISSSKLQELGVDGLLNRYLLLALQHASGKPYENLTKCQSIVTVLPKDWFQGSGQTTLNCLGSFSRYLESLANALKMRGEGSTPQEKKKARSGIKKVISMLVQIRALDKAEAVKLSV